MLFGVYGYFDNLINLWGYRIGEQKNKIELL